MPPAVDVTAACICITQSAKLFAAGIRPAPKLFNVVNPTKAPVATPVGATETKACEQKSMRREIRIRERSKDSSFASCGRVGLGFFPGVEGVTGEVGEIVATGLERAITEVAGVVLDGTVAFVLGLGLKVEMTP